MVIVEVRNMETGKKYKDIKFKTLTSKEEVMAITTGRAEPQYNLVFDDGTTIRQIYYDKYEAAPSGGKRKSRRNRKSRQKSKKTIKKRRKSNNRRR
jgi:hypothetical protein